MGLAERIKVAMGDMGNAEFARACGVASASVTFWLSGDTKSLKAETAAKMEKVTGYRSAWIVTGLGPRRVEDKEDAAWPFKRVPQEKIAALDPDQRAYIEGRLVEMLENLVPKKHGATFKKFPLREDVKRKDDNRKSGR
jgi:hypothetical protein